MNNEIFINSNKNLYESLEYFQIENNILNFNDNGKIYRFPIYNINLSILNPNLYLLKPRDIFRVIYLLELLYKDNISEYDYNFIEQYVNKYLNLEDKRLEGQEIDNNEVECLGIPIYTSYEPSFIDKPTSISIQTLINSHSEKIENSQSKGQRLVLINPEFGKFSEDDNQNDFVELGKAGFTSIMLILVTVILTVLYIVYFVAK